MKTADHATDNPLPATATPLAPSLPTATRGPLPTAQQLTTDGCCVGPFWGPESDGVYFLDRSASGELGTYRVDLAGSPPTLVDPGAAVFSPDLSLMATSVGNVVSVTDRATETVWHVPSDGRMVRFSPASDWVAWQIQSSNVANLDRRRWTLQLGSVVSHEITTPLNGIGGGFVGWGQGEGSLLSSGRLELDGPQGLWRSSLEGGETRLLFAADRIRSPLVSPDGKWVALTVAFSADQSQDGLWIVSTSGDGAVKVPRFGAYRWRGAGQLMVIPLGNGRAPIQLFQVDSSSGRMAELELAPDAIPGIANNTWEVSPDGRWLVYQSTVDRNLWLLHLPVTPEGP